MSWIGCLQLQGQLSFKAPAIHGCFDIQDNLQDMVCIYNGIMDFFFRMFVCLFFLFLFLFFSSVFSLLSNIRT